MNQIVVSAKQIPNMRYNSIDKGNLAFSDPNHWNYAKVVDSQFVVILVCQPSFIYLFGDFLNDVEVAFERTVSMLAQFGKSGFEELEGIFN